MKVIVEINERYPDYDFSQYKAEDKELELRYGNMKTVNVSLETLKYWGKVTKKYDAMQLEIETVMKKQHPEMYL